MNHRRGMAGPTRSRNRLGATEAGAPRPPKPGETVTDADVKAWLQGRDRHELVAMLADQAKGDGALGRMLRLAAAKSRSKKIDLAPYRTAVQRAVLTDDYIDIRHMPDYAHGIEEAVSGIEDLLKEGYAAEVVELAEDALEVVETAFEACDDSDGYLGSVLDDLQDLHHCACQKAKPNPEALAERLFRKEISSGYDVFYGAAGTYADVLGPEGMATYRRLAEDRWAALRPLEPGVREDAGSSERFKITSIMTSLARQTGVAGTPPACPHAGSARRSDASARASLPATRVGEWE